MANMVLLICGCGCKTRGFAEFCYYCGKEFPEGDLKKIKKNKEKAYRLYLEWKKEYCGNGNSTKHVLQCAGIRIKFYCPGCGMEINPG